MPIVKCASCGWQGKDEELTWIDEDQDNFDYCPNCLSSNTYVVKSKKKNENRHRIKASELLSMLEVV